MNLIADGKIGGSTFVRMLRLMRLFKNERYAASFQCFGHLLSENAAVLAVTASLRASSGVFAVVRDERPTTRDAKSGQTLDSSVR